MEELLRAIGFPIRNRKDLEPWIEKAVDRGEVYRAQVDGGVIGAFHWDLGRDLSLWVYFSHEQDNPEQLTMTGVMPGFLGETVYTFQNLALAKLPDPSVEWKIEGDIEQLGSRVEVFLINLYQHPGSIDTKKEFPVHCSGLMTEGKFVPAESQSDLERAQEIVKRAQDSGDEINVDQMVAMMEACFLPMGVEGYCRFKGKVLDMRQTANFHTGEKLYRMRLDCGPMVIDSIASHTILKEAPSMGRILEGMIWMEGMITP